MNFREGQPIYQQIAERLMDEILAGKYISDERIPGVREYSLLLQVNVNTTVKAFDILARQGIIYNKRGLGSFVSAEAVDIIHRLRSDDVLNGMLHELARQMRLLNIPVDKVTERLKKLLNEDSGSTIVD
jgi:transcriptional regulator, gntR family